MPRKRQGVWSGQAFDPFILIVNNYYRYFKIFRVEHAVWCCYTVYDLMLHRLLTGYPDV